MKTIVHPHGSRGHANHGWLRTSHSFSFAQWQDPERMNFGALRVLNDDCVVGGAGFGAHPHDNMEILSIPLSGALEHEDNMGNQTVIQEGEVQIMSAGTGVVHSEKNHHAKEEVHFLQIWVFPDRRNISPTYDQIKVPLEGDSGNLPCIASPDGSEGVRIHQNAWFYMGRMQKGGHHTHRMHGEGQGLYAMVLEGQAQIGGIALGRRDAVGIWETPDLQIDTSEDSQILLMEVPMRW
jgi:hypothetical protein